MAKCEGGVSRKIRYLRTISIQNKKISEKLSKKLKNGSNYFLKKSNFIIM